MWIPPVVSLFTVAHRDLEDLATSGATHRDQVIDLLAPYVKGGKSGLFGAGVGKTVIDQELINNITLLRVVGIAGVGERVRA